MISLFTLSNQFSCSSWNFKLYKLCRCQSIIKNQKSNTTTEPLSGWKSHVCVQYHLSSYLNTIFHALIAKDCHYSKHIFKYTGIRHLRSTICWWPHVVIIRQQPNKCDTSHPPSQELKRSTHKHFSITDNLVTILHSNLFVSPPCKP